MSKKINNAINQKAGRSAQPAKANSHSRETVEKVKKLLAEEATFLSAAKKNQIEATVRAFRAGVIIETEVDTSHGTGGVAKFATAIGVSIQAAYDYTYLARGAYQEDVIRQHPELSRKYFQVIGRRINSFEDFLGVLVAATLVTFPLWIDPDAEDKEPDVDLVDSVASLVKDTREHINKELKVGYVLSGDLDVRGEGTKLNLQLSSRAGNEDREKKAIQEIGQLRERIAKLTNNRIFNVDVSAYKVTKEAVKKAAEVETGRTSRGILREVRRQRDSAASINQGTPAQILVAEERVLRGRSEMLLMDRSLFPERFVDVVITDPPYSQEYYDAWRDDTSIDHDAESTVGKQAHLVGRIAELLVRRKIIKERFMWFSFCPIDYVHVFLPPILKAFRSLKAVHQVLVWDKDRTPKIGGTQYFGRKAEAILYISVNRPLGSIGEDGKQTSLHSSLITEKAPDQDGDNFFWKPKPLLKYLITLSTYSEKTEEAKRQVILDPFAGSGSTGVAAIECDRDFRLIESHATQFQTAKAEILKALKTKSKA